MMLVTTLIATAVIAMILSLMGLKKNAAFYGAVFAFGGYGIITLPTEWYPAAFYFVAIMTISGCVWVWFRRTRGGEKFTWNRTIVRSLIAIPFAASVNLIAAPEDIIAGMGTAAVEAAFDEAFSEYLTAVVAILVIYLVPRIVRKLIPSKVAAE